MTDIMIGALVTLSIAFIIAVVTLAFKNSEAYWKLGKLLIGGLVFAIVFYAGYGAGSFSGGVRAIKQIENGVKLSEVDTSLSSMPIFIMMMVGFFIVFLSIFPEYLGITTPKKLKGRDE